MKKTYKAMLTGILVGLLSGPQWGYAAASGNYTDLLPIGAAGNTTVISNGSGWSLTTIPPTQTFGDSLSRLIDTVFQSTTSATINATTATSTFTALSGQGGVGSTTFPAAWIANGRSIEVSVDGVYSTANPGPTWNWGVLLGTTTVLTTGALASAGGQATQHFHARAVMTVMATGTSGTLMGEYEVFVTSAASSTGASVVSFSTGTNSATVDLTTQLTVNPTLAWGTANSSMTVRNASVKFLN